MRFLPAILVGAILAMIIVLYFDKEKNNSMMLCAEFFMENYSYQQLIGREFFQYIMLSRLPLLIVGILNAINLLGERFNGILILMGSFCLVFLLAEFALYYKLRALVLLIGMITPQWYFYVGAFILFDRARKEKIQENMKAAITAFLIGNLGFLIGIAMELSVNPMWIKTLVDM